MKPHSQMTPRKAGGRQRAPCALESVSGGQSSKGKGDVASRGQQCLTVRKQCRVGTERGAGLGDVGFIVYEMELLTASSPRPSASFYLTM